MTARTIQGGAENPPHCLGNLDTIRLARVQWLDTHPSSEDEAKTEDALNAYKVIKTSTFIHSLRDKSLLYIKRNSGILSRVNMIYRSKLNGGQDPPKDQVIP